MSSPSPPRRILLPIRLRLAAWYSLLLGVMLVLVSILVYSTLTANLDSDLDQSLRTHAQQVIQNSRVDINGPFVTLELPPAEMTASDIFVQFVDSSGQIRATSPNLNDQRLPVSPAALDVASGAAGQFESCTVGGQPLRLYDAPLSLRGRPIGLIQVGRLLKPVQDTAAQLRILLALGSIMALLIALGLGWLVSGQALRPLERLTRTAEHIGAALDFNRRVEYTGPPDEVGRLAATFNGMLDRLQGAYADVQDSAHRLEAALTAQQRFVADASHELRTPLTAIRGNAELLERVPNMDPEDRQASIDQIANEAQRMSRLVNDLLALARADAGQHLRKEPVAIAPLVAEAEAAARHLPGGQRLQIAGPPAEAVVLGDGDHLRQLLLILLDNGLKYTPPDGRVTLSSVVRDGQVEISVADTGIGIPPEALPLIFDRFYRADPARTAGGTGLGLAIAGWIVSEHGGQIRVESAPNAGSTFTVVLPVAAAGVEADAQSDDAATFAAPEHNGALPARNGATAMLPPPTPPAPPAEAPAEEPAERPVAPVGPTG